MSFKLISQGPTEKEALRGDTDLLEHHKLRRIARLVLAGEGTTGQVGDYLDSIPHAREFRKGPGTDLAPVADLYPSSVKPDFAPLDRSALDSSFALGAGAVALTEKELGVPVDVKELTGNMIERKEKEETPKKPLTKIRLVMGKK